MGRVTVELEISNYHDVHLAESKVISKEEVRRVQAIGVVDTGANLLVLPQWMARDLGLASAGSVRVRYADRRARSRALVRDAHVKILGRQSTFDALVEPDRETVLVGAIVLEAMDLLVDCGKQKVYPRDPDQMIAEVE